MLENKNPKRRDDFNGHGSVTFAEGNEQGKYKQGLKLGKCFLLKDEKIREIRGNFKDNMLQVFYTLFLACVYPYLWKWDMLKYFYI